jgi:hypothetical protein
VLLKLPSLEVTVSLLPSDGVPEAGVVARRALGFPNIPPLKGPSAGGAVGVDPVTRAAVPSAGFEGRPNNPAVGALVVSKH